MNRYEYSYIARANYQEALAENYQRDIKGDKRRKTDNKSKGDKENDRYRDN